MKTQVKGSEESHFISIKNNNKARKDYLDFLRALAIISVVSLHTLQRIPGYHIGWIFEFGVPIFLLISGALMIEKAEKLTVREFYIKYGKRICQFIVLIPICSIVTNTLLWYCMGDIDLPLANSKPSDLESMRVGFLSIGEAFNKAITQGNGIFPSALNISQSHVWYLYLITSLYISLPYLARMTRGLSPNALLLFCFFVYVSSVSRGAPHALLQTFSIKYLLFFVAGYILVSRKFLYKQLSFATLVCCLALFLLLLRLSNIYQIHHLTSLGVRSLHIFIPVLIMMLAIRCEGLFNWRIVKSLSTCSFGIYLWHFAVLWMMSIWCPLLDCPQWLRLLAFCGVSLLLPWGITLVLCRVKLLRWLVA